MSLYAGAIIAFLFLFIGLVLTAHYAYFNEWRKVDDEEFNEPESWL